MTEKRFGIVIDETGMECISDIVDCVDRDDFEDIVPLLNKLYDENEELKQKIKSINEILSKDIGYVESFEKIEEILK